jgi:heme exporter protein B
MLAGRIDLPARSRSGLVREEFGPWTDFASAKAGARTETHRSPFDTARRSASSLLRTNNVPSFFIMTVLDRFARLVRRELALAFRERADTALTVLFFVLGAILFPFGVGPEPNLLAAISAGIVWVMALFAAMLSLERLFAPDAEDGSLEQLALLGLPLEAVVLAKACAHWLATGLPLLVAAPFIAVMLHFPTAGLGALVLALALGTPALSLIGTVGAALVIGARRGGVLLTLLVLPLVIPTLIFGAAAVDAALAGTGARAHLLLLSGISLGTLALAPWAAAAALRQALD